MANCEFTGCTAVNARPSAVAIYPPDSVMRFYKTDRFLTRMIMGLILCDEHRAGLKVADIFPDHQLEPVIAMCERTSRTKVDRSKTKIIAVEFTDPDYVKLLEMRAEAAARDGKAPL